MTSLIALLRAHRPVCWSCCSREIGLALHGEKTDEHSFDYKIKEQNTIRERGERYGPLASMRMCSPCPRVYSDLMGTVRAGGADRCCLQTTHPSWRTFYDLRHRSCTGQYHSRDSSTPRERQTFSNCSADPALSWVSWHFSGQGVARHLFAPKSRERGIVKQ